MATTPVQPRRRLSKEARRAKLIAAAEAVFGEVGYGGATMELIAAHDGVTRSLLYEHFASLDEVYLECHRAAREEMEERLLEAALAAGPELKGQLQAGLHAYFDYVAERPQRFKLLYGSSGPGGPLAEQTAELRFTSAARIAALFAAAVPHVPSEETEAAAHIISGAAEQLARWRHRNPELAIETLVDHVMTAIWPGVQQRLDEAGR